jgi:hypothetical protein
MKWNLAVGACLVFSVLCLFFTTPAAAVPQYLNYQGVLRDNNGSLVSGTKAMTFGLFDVASGGTALWSMVSSEVAVSNGLYNVQLGPLTYTELGSGRRWLEVMIGADLLSPRLEILSAAYAVTAGSAENAAKLGNYTPAATGASIIPITDINGKIDPSLIPAVGTIESVSYAVLSGTATTAASASSVNGTVSAEAASGFALFANGKIGAAGSCLGSDIITAGNTSITITNAGLLSATSMVFVSGGVVAGYDPGGIYSYRKGDDRFTVTITNAAPVGGYPFNYLIIN